MLMLVIVITTAVENIFSSPHNGILKVIFDKCLTLIEDEMARMICMLSQIIPLVWFNSWEDGDLVGCH